MKLKNAMLVAALVVGSLFAGNTAVFAQAGGGRAPMTSATLITRIQTALGETNKLSDAVVAKVTPVLDKMVKAQAELRADTTTPQADKQTKRMAITTEASDAIKAIVTADQFKVIQPLLQRGGRRGGAAGGAPATPAPGA